MPVLPFALLLFAAPQQDPDARARALIDLLQSDEAPARRKAGEDLVELGAAAVPVILQALAGDPEAVRRQVTDIVKRLGQPGWKERDEAMRALSRVGAAALPVLKARARETDPEIRWRVMAAIAEIEERGAQETAIHTARNAALCEALGRLNDARAVPALLKAAQEQAPSPVLTRAVEALGRCRALLTEAQADEACGAAINAIDTPDGAGPLIAVRAAGLLRSAVAVPKLVSLVEDPSVADAHLKGEAMTGLVRLGGAVATAAVIRQLDHDDPYVREAAQAALAPAGVPLPGYDPRLPAAGNEKAITAARSWWQLKFSKAWED